MAENNNNNNNSTDLSSLVTSINKLVKLLEQKNGPILDGLTDDEAKKKKIDEYYQEQELKEKSKYIRQLQKENEKIQEMLNDDTISQKDKENLRKREKVINDEINAINNGRITELEKTKLIEQERNKIEQERLKKVSNWTNGVTEFVNGLGAGHDLYMANRKREVRENRLAFDRGQKLFKADLDLRRVMTERTMTTLNSLMSETATVSSRSISAQARTEANSYIDYVAAQSIAQQDFDMQMKQSALDTTKAHIDATKNMAKGLGGILGLIPGYGKAINAVLNGIVAVGDTVAQKYISSVEFDIEKMKQEKEIYQGFMDNIKGVTDRFKSIADNFANIANGIVDKMRESDTIYKQTGLGLGFTGDVYSNYMRKRAPELAKLFNLDAQQIAEIQTGYTSASGRNVLFSDKEFNQTEAISRAFSMSRGEVGSFIGGLNVFNTSVNDAESVMLRMHKSLNKIGLNTGKFSKELVQNMKLAEKYNFKSSVENMAKLTQWAQQTRFNLQSATGFADKMMSNNIGDVLEATAQLQVLGGSAAMYADPFAIMYESANDVGALAQRMNKMVEGVGGKFNKTTGEVDFVGAERRLADAIGAITGQSREDILNQRRKSVTQSQINTQLRGSSLTEEDLLLIGNHATYDTKSKSFKINTLDNKSYSLSDIKNMNSGQFANIKEMLAPTTTEDSLIDIVKNTRSLVDIENAQLSQLQLQTGLDLWSTIGENSKKLLESQWDLYSNTKDGLGEALTQSLNSQLNLTLETNKEIIQLLGDDEYQKGMLDYYKYVENGIGKISKYSQAELNMLAILADKNGAKNMSDVLLDVSKIFTTNDKNRDSEIANLKKKYSSAEQRAIIEALLGDNYDKTNQTQTFASATTQKDGVGLLNGSYISNASNVKSINDGIVKTHIADEYMAAKPNGPIDKLFNGIIAMIQEMYANQGGKSGVSTTPLNVRLDGRLDLSQNNSNINLVEIIKRDPVQSRDLIRILMKALDSTQHGKITTLHNI